MRVYADSSFDLMHVAFALELECELFITSDERQSQIAKEEGLDLFYTGN
jgi:hypothetical protein